MKKFWIIFGCVLIMAGSLWAAHIGGFPAQLAVALGALGASITSISLKS